MTDRPEYIQMRRDYDRGVGLVAGRIIKVGYGDEALDPGKALALCGPAHDDGGPYALPVVPPPEESDHDD